MWYLFGQDYHGRVGYSHLQTPTRVEKETDAGRNLIQHTLPVTSRKIMTTNQTEELYEAADEDYEPVEDEESVELEAENSDFEVQLWYAEWLGS